MQTNVSEKLLNYILENQSEVLELQKKQFAVTCPFLIIIRKNLRKSMGFYTPLDVMEENQEIHEQMEFIKHHNYFLFLVMTRQFGLIRGIFPLIDFARERVLADEIEKEWAALEERNRHILNQHQVFKEQALKILQQLNTVANYLDLRTMGLSNMDILFYYEKEIERIEKERYTEKFRFLQQSFQSQDTVIISFIDAILVDFNITPEIKEQLDKDKAVYLEKRYQLMNALQKSINENASPDQIKAQIAELLEAETIFLNKVSMIARANPQNHKIADIEHQLVQGFIKLKEELNQIDLRKDGQLREIYPQKTKAEREVNLEVKMRINNIISPLVEGDQNHLDENQLKNFEATLIDLKSIKNALSEANGTKEIHEITNSFLNKMKFMENFLKPPLLTTEELDKLNANLIQLREKNQYAGNPRIQTELHRVAHEVQREQQKSGISAKNNSENVISTMSDSVDDLPEQVTDFSSNYSSSLKDKLKEIKPQQNEENLQEDQIQMLLEQLENAKKIIQDKIDIDEIKPKKIAQVERFIKLYDEFLQDLNSCHAKAGFKILKEFEDIPQINEILKKVEPMIEFKKESKNYVGALRK